MWTPWTNARWSQRPATTSHVHTIPLLHIRAHWERAAWRCQRWMYIFRERTDRRRPSGVFVEVDAKRFKLIGLLFLIFLLSWLFCSWRKTTLFLSSCKGEVVGNSFWHHFNLLITQPSSCSGRHAGMKTTFFNCLGFDAIWLKNRPKNTSIDELRRICCHFLFEIVGKHFPF